MSEDQGSFDLGDLPDVGPELEAVADGKLIDKFWPRRFVELVDITEATLKRETGQEDVRALSERIALEIARYCGSKPMYLPFPGKKISSLLRARRIYRDQGRVSPEDLAARENICVPQVYRDIATMTAIERHRRQPSLFGGATIPTLGGRKVPVQDQD
jgi:Mor family transcriptional regulator